MSWWGLLETSYSWYDRSDVGASYQGFTGMTYEVIALRDNSIIVKANAASCALTKRLVRPTVSLHSRR